LKKKLIWVAVIVVVFLTCEAGSTIKFKRRVNEKNSTIITYTSAGVPLSRKPGNLEFLTDPYTIYRMKPDQKSILADINSHGFRTAEFNQKKNADEYRIVITGGSAAFGMNMWNDGKMFDKILEHRLNETSTGIKFTVINTGTPGYNSSQEIALFVHYLRKYDPDMIINFTGWNDFYVPVLTPGNNPELHPLYIAYEKLMVKGPLSALADKSLFFYAVRRETNRVIGQLARRVKSNDTPSNWQYYPSSVGCFTRNIGTFAALAESLDMAHIVMLQPEITHKTNPCDYEKENIRNSGEEYAAAVIKTYEEFDRGLSSIPGEFDHTAYSNFTDVFGDTPECIFTDFVHFNELGHSMVADAMYGVVSDYLAGN